MNYMTKLWGPIVWSFFHVFAQQINEDFFIKNKSSCLSLLENICYTLPCPICSDHAKTFLKNYNFKYIKTKNELILFFYKFHNSVNLRLKKPIFNFIDLEIYKRGKILKISEIMVKQLNKPLRNDNFILGMFKSFAANRAYNFVIKNKNNFVLL